MQAIYGACKVLSGGEWMESHLLATVCGRGTQGTPRAPRAQPGHPGHTQGTQGTQFLRSYSHDTVDGCEIMHQLLGVLYHCF